MSKEFYGYCFILNNGGKRYMSFFRNKNKAYKHAYEVQQRMNSAGGEFTEGVDWAVDTLEFE